jgi:hypothetical protein
MHPSIHPSIYIAYIHPHIDTQITLFPVAYHILRMYNHTYRINRDDGSKDKDRRLDMEEEGEAKSAVCGVCRCLAPHTHTTVTNCDSTDETNTT